MRFRRIPLLSLMLLTTLPSPAPADCDALRLFREGKPLEAKASFQELLRNAERTVQEKPAASAKQMLWQALMSFAWFLDETGEHREAIKYSNRALDLGTELKNNFMIGRSLAWLGWAYASLGLYETAQKFYSEALKYGAPDGKPLIIHVWGLSKQELGYLFFKMGDTVNAKKFLAETTDFARANGILIGVAEGGVRLAEIALHEGNLGEAARFAAEAREAAEKCHCTPFTLVHAKATQAAIAQQRLALDPAQFGSAQQAADAVYEEAKKLGIRRFVAEAQLLQAKLIPAQDFEKRYTLVREAFESLANMESERRGDAEAAMGKIFLEEANTGLAKFYFEHGVQVNDQMLRNYDKAFLLRDLAELHGMLGEREQVLKKLRDSVDQALSTGALPQAADAQQQLFRELSQLGYTKIAAKWGKDALKSYDQLIAREADEHLGAALERKRLALLEEMSGDTLKVLPLPTSQPE